MVGEEKRERNCLDEKQDLVETKPTSFCSRVKKVVFAESNIC